MEVRETTEFSLWLRGLRDVRAKARIAERVRRMSLGNFGDVSPVGEGLSELRIHYGPGYRVYFVRKGDTLVILLCGGEKKTQAKDTEKAKSMAKRLE